MTPKIKLGLASGFLLTLAACAGPDVQSERPTLRVDYPHLSEDPGANGVEAGPKAAREGVEVRLRSEYAGKDIISIVASPVLEDKRGSGGNPAIGMSEIRVSVAKLVPYTIRISVSKVPEYGRLWLRSVHEARSERYGVIWIEAGYWDHEIIKIGETDVATLEYRECMRLIRNGADPLHLVIRSRSGRVKSIEGFSYAALGTFRRYD